MATIQQDIVDFVGSTRVWLAEQATELLRLEGKGREGEDDWLRIMNNIEEAEWMLAMVNDIDNPIDDAGNLVLYFSTDVTEEELRQLMSDYSHKWEVNIGPYIETGFEVVTILNEVPVGGAGGGSITLPVGGGVGDRLVYAGGGQLTWEKPATVFQGDEI